MGKGWNTKFSLKVEALDIEIPEYFWKNGEEEGETMRVLKIISGQLHNSSGFDDEGCQTGWVGTWCCRNVWWRP